MSEKSKRPFTVGFCGRSGSGKSFAAKKVSHLLSAPYIDCDAVYHELLEPNGKEPSACALAIEHALGGGFLSADGILDRKKLAGVVFSDTNMLEQLDNITHKFIRREAERRMSENKSEYAVLDAVLLPFSCCKDLCDVMVAVIADDESSVLRILERDKITKEDAQRRLSSQPSREEFSSASDIILHNSVCDADIDLQCTEIARTVRELMQKSIQT